MIVLRRHGRRTILPASIKVIVVPRTTIV